MPAYMSAHKDDRARPVNCNCPYREANGRCHDDCKLFKSVVLKEKK